MIEFQLDVYGEGSERSYLLDLCEESVNLKNKVKFHGNVSRNEVWTAMAASDVFCMPSVNETLGLVYLEAMACGCITVGSKGEGIDGVIKDGYNGFLVNADSYTDIANKILDISKMTAMEMDIIRANAISTMEKYTEENASKHYLLAVQNILSDTEKFK